jgi:pimeloyl-ACP methyl ester carboxylesterase
VHIHGHSLGGAVAQAYVRAHPDQVRTVALANIGVPSAQRMRLARLLMLLLTLIPGRAARSLFEARIRRNLASLPEEERIFYTHYLAELSSKYLTKGYLLNQLRCMQDFVDRYHLAPQDLLGWPGRILILESQDDTGFTVAERRALRELYPQAQVHTFAAAGHFAGAVRREEYDDVLARFLRGVE